MKFLTFRSVVRAVGLASLGAALICAGLAVYCAFDVASFYAGAQRLSGTVVAVTRLPGGNGPVVEYTDVAGIRQVKQFSPLYAVDEQMIGQPRTVLYNSRHKVVQAIDSPWNWVGLIIYGPTSAGFFLVTVVAFCVVGLPWRNHSNSHGK